MAAKILIVDDEPNIVVPLEFLIEQHGYEVLVAQSGEESIEIIAKDKPALVLLDIMLPGIDGYEVCEIIKLNSEWRDIKVIFLTAKGRSIDIGKGMILGADAYITKPFSNEEIIRHIKELLGNA